MYACMNVCVYALMCVCVCMYDDANVRELAEVLADVSRHVSWSAESPALCVCVCSCVCVCVRARARVRDFLPLSLSLSLTHTHIHTQPYTHTYAHKSSTYMQVSMLPVEALQVEAGMCCLDMCACPGSKTMQLLEAVASGVTSNGLV